MDLNRRRIAEEERKKRIFNAKWRQIGLDLPALDRQIHEKALDRRREEERERGFAEEAKRQSLLADLLEQDKAEQARRLRQDVDLYRRQEQRPEYRREFDLNDPQLRKKERPPPDDCPPSGLQTFEGEDPGGERRTREQKGQFRDLLLQQMHEKRLRSFQEDRAKHEWEVLMLQHDSFAQQVAAMEKRHNKELSSALEEQNLRLAREKKTGTLQERMREDAEKKKEIAFQKNSDLLTEEPGVARSRLGPNRIVPDRWKGMSKEQRAEYRAGQMGQVVDNRRRREEEDRENAAWDEMRVHQDALAQMMEREERDAVREGCGRVVEENRSLATEQRNRKDFLEKMVYKTRVERGFFDQFNTSSRISQLQNSWSMAHPHKCLPETAFKLSLLLLLLATCSSSSQQQQEEDEDFTPLKRSSSPFYQDVLMGYYKRRLGNGGLTGVSGLSEEEVAKRALSLLAHWRPQLLQGMTKVSTRSDRLSARGGLVRPLGQPLRWG